MSQRDGLSNGAPNGLINCRSISTFRMAVHAVPARLFIGLFFSFEEKNMSHEVAVLKASRQGARVLFQALFS